VDNSYLTVRCQNRKAHIHMGQPKEGNVVAFLGCQSILVRCPDSKCRGWVRLDFNFNGLSIDFRKAGVVQSSIPPGSLPLDTSKAAVIIGGDNP
jgi:hypothetical protein